MQKYEIKDFSHLKNIGEISEKAMNMHLKLYEGYVNNTNLILEKLNFLKGQQNENPEYFAKFTPEFNELNRRFGWEWNGMRNHELFFESLSPNPDEGKSLSLGEGFRERVMDLQNICKIRGIGWAMLVQDKKTKQLLNVWVNEHDAGMLSDVNIILNIDMFEHAYISDFGTDRQKYLDSIFAHIDWEVVESRLI